MNTRGDTALVVAGGYPPAVPFLHKLMHQAAYIVAADSGARHIIQSGAYPDALIGDFDSLERGLLEQLQQGACRVVRLPVEKDQTDLEAALDHCVLQGFKDIQVVAALTGQRLDHLLGTILLLPKYLQAGVRVRLIAEEGRFAEVIDSEICFSGQAGAYVSLLPLTLRVVGVFTTGLRYQLDNGTLRMGSTLGVSNQMIASTASVTLKEGLLLVVKEADS